jgi:hypothetical protein
MQALLSKLPAFALPFVTRSLRGGRGKRYIIFSLVIAALTGICGLWLALGSGTFEQSLRVELGLEQHEFVRERQSFTVYVHEGYELRAVERELENIAIYGHQTFDERRPVYYGQGFELVDWGRTQVELAAWSPAHGAENLELRERARGLLGVTQYEYVDMWNSSFPWYDRQEVANLRKVLDSHGMPSVEQYRSPLGFGDALRITGFIAGLLLAALATVFAPLLAAVQQAQERHENTLMPLTGTALGPRELTLGLASGPAAVVAIFAVPQLVVFLLCATLAGEVLVAGALLAALVTTGALFVFGGQLLGQLMGHRRTPGVIGISLMSVLGVAWLAGAALAADADHEVAGMSAVLPHMGLSALLAEVFVDVPLSFSRVFVGTFVWTVGAAVLGWLAMTALARRLEGREGPLLSAGQALVGALTCVGLVNVALPTQMYDVEAVRQYIGLAMLALPLMLLLMARVPTGDTPPRMRKLPMLGLLLEFAAWGAAHVVVSGALVGISMQALHPVALLWLGWCVLVLGLIAIRVVAVPAKIATNVWTAFCGLSLTVGFAQAAYWGLENGRKDVTDIFVLMELSPVLGLLQIALTVWIPVSLIRHLRKNLGAIS